MYASVLPMKYFIPDTYEEEQERRERFKETPQKPSTMAEDTVDIGETIAKIESLAASRSTFELSDLLPEELANACAIMQKSLPVDTLSTVMPLMAGYSGLLKLGTRVAKSYDFDVPCNLFIAVVCISGGMKTPTKQRLIDKPAEQIKKDASRQYKSAYKDWLESCQGKDKNLKEPPPDRYFPHLSDVTTAALTQHLVHSESLGLGQLLIRDELSGLFASVENDTKKGSGTGEAQLLETFDGGEYYSIRIEAKHRCYDSCHLSVYGNIQPEALKELVNGNDSKGKFARFLFVRLPTRLIQYEDDDPSDAELAQWDHANDVLQRYAKALYTMPPRTYRLNRAARCIFNRWWESHQRRIQQPYTPPVIRSLLGKASAHALRVTGMLHLMQVVAGDVGPQDPITEATTAYGIQIVDQLLAETEAFYEEEETDQLRLARHIHYLSWNNGEPIVVDHQTARNRAGRKQREYCTASHFKKAALQLQERGFGQTTSEGRAMTFIASREMSSRHV